MRQFKQINKVIFPLTFLVLSVTPTANAVEENIISSFKSKFSNLKNQLDLCQNQRPDQIAALNISVHLAPDGTVLSVTSTDEAEDRDKSGYYQYFQCIESVLKNSTPFDLPAEKYEIWKQITLKFDTEFHP
ncbi:cell envelope integrity protein TolA [Kiloniella laminariae]|uniref:Cell envelope integrity protein TolA n=1 Tax=Kiloniella laminariae TaxID=454162 RepID=A0ABT4LFZ8_9PROT|nr:cell envelope integrity protein TolA [Kiloniella laminariae]